MKNFYSKEYEVPSSYIWFWNPTSALNHILGSVDLIKIIPRKFVKNLTLDFPLLGKRRIGLLGFNMPDPFVLKEKKPKGILAAGYSTLPIQNKPS